MRIFIITLLTFALIFVVSTVVMAQNPDVPIPLLPGAPDLAPIDGGLGLLAAAGGAYAWKKLRNRKD